MYTAPKLVELLEQQHNNRNQSGLFKKGTFHIQWRAKVGSFPHPDGETIVSAGEPCGPWPTNQQQPRQDIVKDHKGRERTIHRLEQYYTELHALPLNGYIPGSSIRGLVRSWAKQNPDLQHRMEQLLGHQDNQQNQIYAGKIEFLDAYPENPTPLSIDIVNPQERFQVYHDSTKQSNPTPLYTLGNGDDPIPVTIAIRGTSPHKVTPAEVEEVWGWVEQALSFYGVGSRTASGYGALSKKGVTVQSPGDYRSKTFTFSLYSQGCYGANQSQGHEELRPSHWRGWLRSWLLRFLLGVMSEDNALLDPRVSYGQV
jgi:CRISPR-associated protein Cmr6